MDFDDRKKMKLNTIIAVVVVVVAVINVPSVFSLYAQSDSSTDNHTQGCV
jgi:hypothetical protein